LRPMPPDIVGCYCPSCFDLTEPSASKGDAAAL